jgi:hypothetical protein
LSDAHKSEVAGLMTGGRSMKGNGISEKEKGKWSAKAPTQEAFLCALWISYQ